MFLNPFTGFFTYWKEQLETPFALEVLLFVPSVRCNLFLGEIFQGLCISHQNTNYQSKRKDRNECLFEFLFICWCYSMSFLSFFILLFFYDFLYFFFYFLRQKHCFICVMVDYREFVVTIITMGLGKSLTLWAWGSYDSSAFSATLSLQLVCAFQI